ncbi:MAG: hypothetical protein HY934_04660 [Candidatus Firestonebacteria bacterium]|nr:hypothetical protein [Candidatus Firestonebacteria bacterium]
MEIFEKQKDIEGNNLDITSCAGVAIIKTKYPFYRGYELAEQLCGNAKKIRKEQENPNGSWLDFHISYGGFSGTIEEIRESHYRSPQGNLLFRPYKINSIEERGIETLITNTIYLKDIKNKFSTSRIKELHKVLTLGKEATKVFMNELNARGLKLPIIKGENYHESIYQEKQIAKDFAITPYFDMIEFMEFYPSFLLEVKNEES